MIEHDQDYYVKLSRAVCGNLDLILENDPILDDLALFNLLLPGPLDQTDLSYAISELANDSVQNINEHVSRNLQSIFCRIFRIEMNRNAGFQDTQENIKKLAIHIWKLLSNCETYWPSSVPITIERTNECRRIINHYFPWFLYLRDLEDELDREYRPQRNVEEPEEEFEEDELDEDEMEEVDPRNILPFPRPRRRPPFIE